MNNVLTQIDNSIEILKSVREQIVQKPVPAGNGFSMLKALEIAEDECKLNLRWRGTGSAKKYTEKYEGVFGRGRFPWCAAFVTWCCDQAGLELPINAPHSAYTFALVEAWQEWAIAEDFYIDQSHLVRPRKGDIVLFDWDQVNVDEKDDDWEDHIGFFMHMNGADYVCAEGNYRDATGFVKRKAHQIQGFVRIPDGYSFD